MACSGGLLPRGFVGAGLRQLDRVGLGLDLRLRGLDLPGKLLLVTAQLPDFVPQPEQFLVVLSQAGKFFALILGLSLLCFLGVCAKLLELLAVCAQRGQLRFLFAGWRRKSRPALSGSTDEQPRQQ